MIHELTALAKPPLRHSGMTMTNRLRIEGTANLLAAGVRVCLYTDQANPTSNKIYAALGYRPVVDMANLVIVP